MCLCMLFCMGQLKFQWGRLKIKKKSLNFHIVIKNIKEGKHMFMYVVLHGIAQIPVGKAQNLAQNELKFPYSD